MAGLKTRCDKFSSAVVAGGVADVVAGCWCSVEIVDYRSILLSPRVLEVDVIKG